MTTAACQRCFRRWSVDPTVAKWPGCPACGGGLRAVDPSLSEPGLLMQRLFQQAQLRRGDTVRGRLPTTYHVEPTPPPTYHVEPTPPPEPQIPWILTDADRDFLRCQRIDPDR